MKEDVKDKHKIKEMLHEEDFSISSKIYCV